MRRLASVVLLALASAACGTANEPVTISPEEIPFPLTRAESPEPAGADLLAFEVAFVRGRRLVMVEREVRTSLTMRETAVRSLLAGPNNRERERGLTTAIPSTTRLLGSIDVFEGVAEVDLSQEFQAAARSEGFLQRVAQVVSTLVAVDGITAVRFSIDGEVAAVPTDRGQTVQRPVTAADYQQRLPRG